MFLKQRGFKALPITKGFNFSPVALHANDKQMRRQNLHILMFLDNAYSHAKDFKLNNVILKFLPANTTSHLQPLDQGNQVG
jgi:hypothetical protein